ncbi:MAG: hypothetical protein EZS28_039977 [Streblomastix strix]|uniref:Uncharacterized protein n=1 Tax=Streblomastix strix TaxID=222440 RepID=A0A5J4U1A3_9EUKA|nr:MAG: hypothetical protein EZS28_039977 [Streblomastix strix]
MAAADPCALNIQPENNLQVVQLPAALQIPQMKQDAVLPFMKSLLNQTANTPEDAHQIQQIESAKFLIEQYYNEKIADMDPTDRRATKYELEALDDRIQSTLGLEVNKKRAIERAGDADLEFEAEVCNLTVDGKRAAATAITSLATEDFESATQWMLVSHHYDRIITSKAQQRQEQGFVPDIQRPSRSKRERFRSPRAGISKLAERRAQEWHNQGNIFNTGLQPNIHCSLKRWKTKENIGLLKHQLLYKTCSLQNKWCGTVETNSPTIRLCKILDIKDAFNNILVQPNLQQLLSFKLKNRSYTYFGLPF